jgi:hypothetical protein
LGTSQADAYRKATGSTAKDNTVYVEASKWAKRPKIRLRILELQQAIGAVNTDKLTYRWEEAMGELEQARAGALAKRDYSAAVGAIRQKCKISGLEVDPRKNAVKPFEDVTDDELDERIKQAQREVAEQQGTSATKH